MLTIPVDQDSIDQATKNQKKLDYVAPCQCLVQTSVAKQFPGKVVTCGTRTVSVGSIRYELDQRGIDLIERFDNGDPIEPCEIGLIDPEIALTAYHDVKE